MKKNTNEIVFGIMLGLVFVALIVWFIIHQPDPLWKIITASFIIIALLVYLIFRTLKMRKDAKANIPIADEMTSKAKVMAGSKAFYLSLYLWMLIFIFNSSFSDNREMLGIGILGSCLLYGICFWYFKKTGDFHE